MRSQSSRARWATLPARNVNRLGRLAGVFLCISCSARSGQLPAQDPDPERARAALATLHVDNQTTHRVAVFYRHVGRIGEVGIGHVDAGEAAAMAPVPAGEPLILVARNAAGDELVLAPRTFGIDGAWTWSIERGSRFVPPPAGSL